MGTPELNTGSHEGDQTAYNIPGDGSVEGFTGLYGQDLDDVRAIMEGWPGTGQAFSQDDEHIIEDDRNHHIIDRGNAI